MIKLLIADDSALMRKFLAEIFRAEGDFEVSLARNGVEALEMARNGAPDVITLDINMPEMDGITCLSHIMVECPKPVVMVSSLTTKDASFRDHHDSPAHHPYISPKVERSKVSLCLPHPRLCAFHVLDDHRNVPASRLAGLALGMCAFVRGQYGSRDLA